MWRIWTAAAGLLLIAIGVPMLVCPGPGALFITSGLALLLTSRLPVRAERDARSASAGRPIDVPYRILESERDADTMSRRSVD